MSISGVFIGILLIALGLVTIKFNRQVAATLGTPSFLYKYFGPGREYGFYILLSFILMFIGLFVMFGLFGIITDLIFKPFRGLIRE
ncbi:MAG TPA: hypothetical protein VJM32_07055 [Candidatus Saccharimonadales bacterium]|nr:hypothetical protein [Candidatus Saccharimonadales bacterium]